MSTPSFTLSPSSSAQASTNSIIKGREPWHSLSSISLQVLISVHRYSILAGSSCIPLTLFHILLHCKLSRPTYEAVNHGYLRERLVPLVSCPQYHPRTWSKDDIGRMMSSAVYWFYPEAWVLLCNWCKLQHCLDVSIPTQSRLQHFSRHYNNEKTANQPNLQVYCHFTHG